MNKNHNFLVNLKCHVCSILKKFSALGYEAIAADFHHRFHVAEVMEMFPQLKYNPFRDRIFKVFSSKIDEHFSFEDFLDLVSVMHENCPLGVKALWAFKVYGERISHSEISL